MTEKHKNFIRISWEEAVQILESNLHDKYGAKGKIIFKHDCGYGGIGDHYEFPHFVDIELSEN